MQPYKCHHTTVNYRR